MTPRSLASAASLCDTEDMLTTILATLALAPVFGADDLTCAVMGSPAPIKTANALDYAGVRYPFCCGGCDGTFGKEPAKFVKKASEGKAAIGFFLFDPVSGLRLEFKEAPANFTDYKGTRYFFENADNKKAFEGMKEKFATAPEKEVLKCSVVGHDFEGYAGAGAFADYEGVRYYFCCGDCLANFKKEPAKYAGPVQSKVQAPKALRPPKGS